MKNKTETPKRVVVKKTVKHSITEPVPNKLNCIQIHNELNKQNTVDIDIRRSHLPWIEKYRPSTTENIKIVDNIKQQIMRMINTKTVPNIILEGPPGVGKTSTIRCIAKEIYKKYYKHMVMELNASDERGIKIQEPIDNFRKMMVHIDPEDIDIIPKFKMVILDEADNMTEKAEHIIGDFIQHSVSDLKFAFTCNTKEKIMSSIQSGCHIIRYPPLTDSIVKRRLLEICSCEKIYKPNMKSEDKQDLHEGLIAITIICNGDLRMAINILQLTFDRFEKITSENVYKIQYKPHPEISKDIMMACISGDLSAATKLIVDLKMSGYSGTDIMTGLRLALRLDICKDIPENIKMEIWKKTCHASYNISKGLDSSTLQIVGCVADIYNECSTKKQ